MTPALYTFTLLAGLTLGWQGCLAVTAFVRQRQASQGRGTPTASPSAPALVIDIRDPAPPYDWRTDPAITHCPACHGRGRMWTIDGRAVRCPCGARPAPKVAAQ